jgi:hypothetical protein
VALRQQQLREQECARINSMKIHNQWRKIMRVAKVEELRGEVEILSQNHEREVDRKDALVQVGTAAAAAAASLTRPDFRHGQVLISTHGPHANMCLPPYQMADCQRMWCTTIRPLCRICCSCWTVTLRLLRSSTRQHWAHTSWCWTACWTCRYVQLACL